MDCSVWYVHFLYRFGYSGAEKNVCGLGLILAFVFTAVFFVWQNHTRKRFVVAVLQECHKMVVAVMAVISFLFRPLYEGGVCRHFYKSEYVWIVFVYYYCCVLVGLDWCVETGRSCQEKHCNVCFACLMLFLSGKKSGENFTDCGCGNCACFGLYCGFIWPKRQKITGPFRKLRLYGSFHRSAVSSVFNLPFASAKHCWTSDCV